MSHNSIDIALRPVESLTPSELDEIWAITARYVDTDRVVYEAKLRALPEVGLWRVRHGPLVGLVSFDVYPVEWESTTCTIVFTSSVVVDERFRGRHLVLKTGLRILLREKCRRPLRRVHWFFDTFSYKSYVLLARNFREFWPRRDQATPDSIARFVGHLAGQRYGGDWCAETGVVRHSGQKRLLPTAAPIDARTLADPDVKFFDSANPRHREGDMLVCLAPLSVSNLGWAVARMLGTLLRRR